MKVGTVYTISVGHHSDKYLCVFVSPAGVEYRRVRKNKSKIDGIRLPETIVIAENYTTTKEK